MNSNSGKALLIAPRKGCMDVLLLALSSDADISVKKAALREFVNVINFLTTLSKTSGKDMGILPILENLLPNDISVLNKIMPSLETLSHNPEDMMSVNLYHLVSDRIEKLKSNTPVEPFPEEESKLINLFMQRYNDANSYGQYRLYKNIIEQIDGTVNAINAYYQGMIASELSVTFKNKQDLKNKITELEKFNTPENQEKLSALREKLIKVEALQNEYLAKAEPLAKIKNMLTRDFSTANLIPILKEAKERNNDNIPVLHAILQVGQLIMNKNISDVADRAKYDLLKQPGLKNLHDKFKLLSTIKTMAQNNSLDSKEARTLLRVAKVSYKDDLLFVKALDLVSSMSSKTTMQTRGANLFQPKEVSRNIDRSHLTIGKSRK